MHSFRYSEHVVEYIHHNIVIVRKRMVPYECLELALSIIRFHEDMDAWYCMLLVLFASLPVKIDVADEWMLLLLCVANK